METIDGIKIGKRRRSPKRLGLDKGYDSDTLRQELRRRRIVPIASYRINCKIDSGTLPASMRAKRLGITSDLKVLPPPEVGRWRLYERMALQLRSFVGISVNVRLDPFALAKSINARVLYLSDVVGLTESSRACLDNIAGWSGGATQDLGDGAHLIILNKKHSLGRQAATLMEEICHILFSHKPSDLISSQTGGRSYNFKIEEEAYAVGAAALVPYHPLKSFLVSGASIRKIANYFGVTRSLIVYRAKGTQLHTFLP